jgi:hypothetical protein
VFFALEPTDEAMVIYQPQRSLCEQAIRHQSAPSDELPRPAHESTRRSPGRAIEGCATLLLPLRQIEDVAERITIAPNDIDFDSLLLKELLHG